MTQNVHLIGCPVDSGKERSGCLMGPDAFRTAGLAGALSDLGLSVHDEGNLALPDLSEITPSGPGYQRKENIGWTRVIADAAETAFQSGMPIFLGGDHSLSLGSVLGSARHAAAQNRPLFVLWLDAHSDFHTPLTSASGNLHGTPLGYVTGRTDFDDFPEVSHPVAQENICIIGLRSVDAAEREALQMAAHCNALPESMLAGMVMGQRLRDAALARAVVQAFQVSGGPVAVITGNGHARKDWGIPAALDQAAPALSILSIGQFETTPQGNAPYDLYLVTDPAERDDPCKAFN